MKCIMNIQYNMQQYPYTHLTMSQITSKNKNINQCYYNNLKLKA